MIAPLDSTRRPAFADLPDRNWIGWLWCVVALVLAIDAVWLLSTQLSLSADSLPELLQVGSLSMLLLIAAHTFRRWERANVLFAGAALMLAAWPALRLYNHLTMSLGFPLVDEWLVGLDQAIGFDWHGYLAFFDSSSVVVSWMRLAYASLSTYVAVLFVVLLLFDEPRRRCMELIRLFLATAIFCTSVGALFPALAAMAYYAPSPDMFAQFSAKTGSYHLEHFLSLRENPAHVLNVADLPGLVTFPSFHTAMGVVAVYCARGRWPLFLSMLTINLLMIASTPIFGSHYAIDVLAGAAVAIGAILIDRRYFGKVPEPFASRPLLVTAPALALRKHQSA